MILGPLAMDDMKLQQLLPVLGTAQSRKIWADCDIRGLAYDSRHVRPGFLFFALSGQRDDGVRHIDEALQRGAVAVVGEAPVALRHVPYIQVAHARHAMADVAAAFFRNPSSALRVVGVTGTNGKTTTAFMIRSLMQAQGHTSGLISTVRYEIGSRQIPAARTTPEAPDIQAMLQKMDQAGCDSVVMEVSSHALDQARVRGVAFDVAVFTNLSPDHLDYHGSMERYAEAKQRLFAQLADSSKDTVAVINADDSCAEMFIHTARDAGAKQVLTYGFTDGADVQMTHARATPQGSEAQLTSPWGQHEVRIHQRGRFNLANAMAALTACAGQGLPMDALVAALPQVEQVPGRLQWVGDAEGAGVYVDYAHTEDALRNALAVLREITPNRLLLVFGCGGDRDQAKRRTMGQVADEAADEVWITSDNPRSESPETIARQVAEGFSSSGRYRIELDRAIAIQAAIAAAQPGDTVLIAGKGHERFQEFAHTVIPFDDVEVARRALEG